MQKVMILGMKSKLPKLLAVLQEKGVLEIKTDGAVCDMSDKADGFVLPDFKDGKMHEVHVILRK